MRRALTVLALLIAVLAVASCEGTSRSSRCSGDTCTISLSGEQTVEVEFGAFERDLRVGPIESGTVTVSARADEARLAVGETATLGGLVVTLTSLSGRDVGLEVRRG